MSYWVIVPAAGIGARLAADRPKQYLQIGGKPLIQYTLEALAACPEVAALAVGLAANDQYWPGWTSIGGKSVLAYPGGATRADTVFAGLQRLRGIVGADQLLMVHDAARPLLQPVLVSALCEAALQCADGALLALPCADTIKRADGDGCVAETLPREQLWQAQTPQMFRYGLLWQALDEARAGLRTVTDEAQAVEALGRRPRLVAGTARNFKVTTADDFQRAKTLLMELET